MRVASLAGAGGGQSKIRRFRTATSAPFIHSQHSNDDDDNNNNNNNDDDDDDKHSVRSKIMTIHSRCNKNNHCEEALWPVGGKSRGIRGTCSGAYELLLL